MAASEIERGSRIQQRITRRFDAIYSWNWIEDNLALGGFFVRNQGVQLDDAKFHEGVLVFPMDGGIVDNLSLRSHLYQNAHLHGTVRDSVLDFVKKKIRLLLGGFRWFKILAPFHRNDAVASEVVDPFAVDEFVRGNGIERFFREARGDGLGCLNECQRCGMRTEKGINGVGFGVPGPLA